MIVIAYVHGRRPVRGVRLILAHPHTPEVRLLHHLKTSNGSWIEARVPKNFLAYLAYLRGELCVYAKSAAVKNPTHLFFSHCFNLLRCDH